MLKVRDSLFPDAVSDSLLQRDEVLCLETFRAGPILALTRDEGRCSDLFARIDAAERSQPVVMYDGRRSAFEPTSLHVIVRPGYGATEVFAALSSDLLDYLGNALSVAGQVVLLADSYAHALELIELKSAFKRAEFPVPVVRRWPGEAKVELALYTPNDCTDSDPVETPEPSRRVVVPPAEPSLSPVLVCA